jgi:hypothetical protein
MITPTKWAGERVQGIAGHTERRTQMLACFRSPTARGFFCAKNFDCHQGFMVNSRKSERPVGTLSPRKGKQVKKTQVFGGFEWLVSGKPVF